MNKKVKKVKKGFTLVELIIVIAIIGVLAMMITPSVMGYVKKAKISNNNASAKSIAMSAEAANAQLVAEGVEMITGKAISYSVSWAQNPAVADVDSKFDVIMKEFMPLDTARAKVSFDANGKVEYVLYSPTSDIKSELDGKAEPSESLGVYKR